MVIEKSTGERLPRAVVEIFRATVVWILGNVISSSLTQSPGNMFFNNEYSEHADVVCVAHHASVLVIVS